MNKTDKRKYLVFDEIGIFDSSYKLLKFKGVMCSTPWVSNKLFKKNEKRRERKKRNK